MRTMSVPIVVPLFSLWHFQSCEYGVCPQKHDTPAFHIICPLLVAYLGVKISAAQRIVITIVFDVTKKEVKDAGHKVVVHRTALPELLTTIVAC